jgi:hypothetical protein
VQTLGLALPHGLQLRTWNLVLLEQIVGLGLDFPICPARPELRLNCQVINRDIANLQQDATYLHLVANVEVEAIAPF